MFAYRKILFLVMIFLINLRECSSYFLKPSSSRLLPSLSLKLSTPLEPFSSFISSSSLSAKKILADVDVLVAGAGISGTSASYEALSQGKSVALMDNREYVGGYFHSNQGKEKSLSSLFFSSLSNFYSFQTLTMSGKLDPTVFFLLKSL